MKISSVELISEEADQHELSAMVNGERIFFKCYGEDLPVRKTYDPFVLASALPTMEQTGNLSVAADQPVSLRLVQGLKKVSGIYSCWETGLRRLNIDAQTAKIEFSKNQFVGCFFSGGIDSLYSYNLHKNKITHLIICRGLDIPLDREEQRWQRTKEAIEKLSKNEGKKVVIIETNVKSKLDLPYKIDCWGLNFISSALWLGLSNLIVPSSVSYLSLGPGGSHILVDPLASTEYTEVIHDSLEKRTLKTKTIIDAGLGIETLRVCNVLTEYNCGICEKCLRTRTALYLYAGKSDALEPLGDFNLLKGVRIEREIIYQMWVELYELSIDKKQYELSRILFNLLRKYRIIKAIKQLDNDILGGAIRKLKLSLSEKVKIFPNSLKLPRH